MRLRWPWTSVARLDDLRARLEEVQREATVRFEDATDRLADAHETIEWLRARVQELEDKRERRERVSMGMAEVPRTERPPIEPMTKELWDYIHGHASPSIQRTMRAEAYKRHAAGEPWDRITEDVLPEEEDGSDSK